MREWITSTAALFLVAFALGQAPPSVPVAQDPEEEPEEEPRFKLNEFTLGLTSLRHSSLISRYGSPIEGLSLHSLRMLWPLTETSPFARLVIRGMPDQDNLIEGVAILNGGNTAIRFDRTEHGHYDFDWRPKDESIKKQFGVTVDHTIAPNIGAFVSYSSTKKSNHFPAPRIPDLTQSQTLAGGFGGEVLGGNLNLTLSDRRIYTDTGVQPTSLQRRIDASYFRVLSDVVSVGGSANFARIEQSGQEGSDIRSYNLFGDWYMGPDTALQFRFGRQDLDINTILNAYVRKRLYTNARLIHRLNGWALQLGYQRKESERVRSDQLFVDVPTSDLFDFRVAGRLGGTRVTFKGSWEDVSSNAVMTTSDPRPLFWGDRATFQARAETGGEAFNAFGAYTYRLDQNDNRNVEIGWHNVALGGSYVFNPDLVGYLEVAFDDFRAVGAAETGQSLDFYFPNARTFAAGMDWARSPDLTASANINYYESGDVRGSQLTLSVRRRISEDDDIELIVAPWRHEDRQFDLTSYYTTILSARYTMRF